MGSLISKVWLRPQICKRTWLQQYGGRQSQLPSVDGKSCDNILPFQNRSKISLYKLYLNNNKITIRNKITYFCIPVISHSKICFTSTFYFVKFTFLLHKYFVNKEFWAYSRPPIKWIANERFHDHSSKQTWCLCTAVLGALTEEWQK